MQQTQIDIGGTTDKGYTMYKEQTGVVENPKVRIIIAWHLISAQAFIIWDSQFVRLLDVGFSRIFRVAKHNVLDED